MPSFQGQGQSRRVPTSDIIFQVPATPQPVTDHFGKFPLIPVRGHGSANISGPPTSIHSSNATPASRNRLPSFGEENNPLIPKRGGNRKRRHYSSLDEAVADASQPNFSTERLYESGGNDSNATLNHKNSDPDRPSPHFGTRYNPAFPTPSNYALPTPETATSDTVSLNTPSPSLFPGGLPRPPHRHPFSQSFEVPKMKTLWLHLLLCLIAYPVLLIFVIFAREKTLFLTRLLLGVGCGITGLVLGLSLLRLARRHLEAATWATVIHQSRYSDNPGVRLRDLAPHAEDPLSAWAGFRLLWNRRSMYPGAARRNRAHYDTRVWSFHIIFFLFLVIAAASLPFIFGRIIHINTRVANQHESYHEAAIKTDISDADVARANDLQQPFNDTPLAWTLMPYSSHGSLPPVVNLQWVTTQGVDTIYFSETTKSQLQPNGSGFGTFETGLATPSLDTQQTASISMLQAGLSPGSIVRQPRWGIRIKCEKIPDPQINILPKSANLSLTYVFIPKETTNNLLDYFEKPPPLPTDFAPPEMVAGDQEWPSNVTKDKTLVVAPFSFNGVTHSYFSHPLYGMGENDSGFVSLEMVLIRLNSTYAHQGEFLAHGDSVLDASGTSTSIGYDAAVCVELFEPWIVEVYNSTVGTPTTLRIVEKNNVVGDFNTGNVREKMDGAPISDPSVRRGLTSKRLQAVYLAAHTNGINQVAKDNGRDSRFAPSPIAISYTAGQGAYGYTSLSAEYLEQSRALADANNILPYFSGSGSMVARVYPDGVLASAFFEPLQLIIALVIIFALGLVAVFFVPRLPLGVPRRGFELYSWVAAFYADELMGVGKGGGEMGPAVLPIGKRMEIEEIEKHIGDVRFRYMT